MSDTQASMTAASSSGETSAVPFTTGDLDALERGLRREIELVRDAQRRSASGTPEERGRALQDAFDVNTIPRGAEAAGMPVERYRAIRESVGEVMTTLDFQGKIDGPQSVDTSHADAALRARLTRDPYATLPTASASALRARVDQLAPVWVEYVTLTAVGG
jgi:hypothetical protein